MHFVNRCTWKSPQYLIIIITMTSFMHVSQKLVFHQSKCISAIKRILSTTAMYVSSSSFVYLCIPCYCDACLKSSALRVGVKTLCYKQVACNNFMTAQKTGLLKSSQPRNSQDEFKRGCSQSKRIIKPVDPEDNVIKTSAKSQD